MLSTLLQWMFVGIAVGGIMKLANRWQGGWPSALLTGIGAAFIIFTVLTAYITYTI